MSYVEFTQEMKQTHKILIPYMLPIHFQIIEKILRQEGYHVEVLKNDHNQIIEEGLQHVHNDTCYPATIVIGQMIDALKSGKYDLDHTALAITQTGGGCRASNYIHLLRKALKQENMEHIPVISVNFSGLEKHSGFKITPRLIISILYAFLYGDLFMWIYNQVRPYELEKGSTKKLLDRSINSLCKNSHSIHFYQLRKNVKKILQDFANIPRSDKQKIKVGIVGEIYLKYSPLGNNHLEDFLIKEDCEPVVSGVLDFALYTIENNKIDYEYYNRNKKQYRINCFLSTYIQHLQNIINEKIKKQNIFTPMEAFKEVQEVGKPFINKGVKMGEGWLLTSEMASLLHSGINNIVSCQPFGCLPNHIVARGMIHKLKQAYPNANIVAIDYDPSATSVNQENRLKLMLSSARYANLIKDNDTKTLAN